MSKICGYSHRPQEENAAIGRTWRLKRCRRFQKYKQETHNKKITFEQKYKGIIMRNLDKHMKNRYRQKRLKK
jgi:hypothetical protein